MAEDAQAATGTAKPTRNYQIGILILLTLANGIVAFDRLTVSYLSPYIVADLGISNAQLGLLASALSGAIAITAFLGGQLADRTGKKKMILIVCTIIFSIGSGAGGLATTFLILFAARFLLGVAEGPMVPISQTVIAESTDPKQRGVAMGFMQMVGAFGIAGVLGPIVATQLADDYGWRMTLLISVIPGLLLAVGIAIFLKPDPKKIIAKAADASKASKDSMMGAIAQLLRIPNMRVALVIAAGITGWLVLQNTFLAVFLTDVKGLSPTTAGKVIAMGGFAGIMGGIGLPFLSDRLGRKPIMIGAALAGICCPIAMLLLPGDPVLLGAAILVGWLPLGIAPLYCATIPTESVNPALATSAVGLSMGFAELFGGFIVPPVAGRVADSFGLGSVFIICICLALIAAFAAMFLKETAPCKVGLPEAS